MFSLFRAEWKKLQRSLFFNVLIILFALGITGYYFYIYSKTIHSDQILSNIEIDIQGSRSFIAELEQQGQTSTLDPESKRALDIYVKSLPLEERQYEGLKTKNWSMWANANKEWQTSNTAKEYWERTYPSRFTYETLIATLQWFEDRNIQPVWPMYHWMTVYDEVFVGEGTEPIIKQGFASRHSSSGSYFNYHVFSKLFSIFGVVLFLFLFSDVVTKEGEGRNGPIYLLRTLPIRKYTFIPIKFGSIFVISLGILIGICLIGIILGTLFDRFGDWDYPILIYGMDYSFHLIPFSLFLLKCTSLFLLVLAFSYSLLFLFSFLTRHALLATGITITILLLGQNLADQYILSDFAHYVPFHYFNSFTIVSNEFAVVHDNFSFSYVNGLLSLSVATILVWIITYTLTFVRSQTRR